MKNFAVIDSDNNIINLVVADSKEIAESISGNSCLEYNIEETVLDLSWTYDGENFIPPVIEEPTPVDPPILQEHPDSIPGETRTDL